MPFFGYRDTTMFLDDKLIRDQPFDDAFPLCRFPATPLRARRGLASYLFCDLKHLIILNHEGVMRPLLFPLHM